MGKGRAVSEIEVEHAPVCNRDVDWDEFNPNAYFAHNYGHLRPEDAEIIKIVTAFFGEALQGPPQGRAIDVGTGANLYPAMMMLPYASDLTLVEQSESNCRWIGEQLAQPHGSWTQFWNAVAEDRPAYQGIEWAAKQEDKAVSAVMRKRATVVHDSLFDIKPDQYDLGTMFFVAESITTQMSEFEHATGLFVGSLKPDAPFAAAFMCDSSGYWVGDRNFPACSVIDEDVERALAQTAKDVKIYPVESKDLRDGYGGMIVATGRRK